MELISIREFGRRNGVSDTTIRKAIAAGKIVKGVKVDDKGSPKIIYDVAQQEYDSFAGVSQKAVQQAAPVTSGEQQEVHHQSRPTDLPPGQITYQEAKRRAAVFDANMKGLELAEKQRTLVNKDKVYRALYAVGQEIKIELQAIPDKCIDDIRAAENRTDAHLILAKAIADALKGLADLGNVEFHGNE